MRVGRALTFSRKFLGTNQLYPQLEKLSGSASTTDKTLARQIVDSYTQPTAPHTNCARSFQKLFETDPEEAKAVSDKAIQLVSSIS